MFCFHRLLLDEFSLLYDERVFTKAKLPKTLHNGLRALADMNENALLIFCTSDQNPALLDKSAAIWYSPLINIFATYPCPCFNREELLGLNSRLLSNSDNSFMGSDLDYIYKITAGIPIYTQIAAHKLFQYRQSSDWKIPLSIDTQKQLLNEIYVLAGAYLAKLWKSFTPDEQLILMYILIAHRGERVRGMRYKIKENDPELFGAGGWRAGRLEQFQIVKRNIIEDRFEINSQLIENYVLEQVRKQEIPELEERRTRFLVFSQAQFNCFKEAINRNRSTIVDIALKLMEQWLRSE